MEDERIRDLIKDVATHGEGIPLNMSGDDLRNNARAKRSGLSEGETPGQGSSRIRPFGHAAAMAWFAGIAALVVAAVVLVGVPSSKHSNSRADATTTTSTPRPRNTTTTIPAPSGPSAAQAALGRAVAATDATGNFDLSFVLTGGTGFAAGSGLTGSGAADLDPIAMQLNNVAGATLSFDPDNAWEQLGGTPQEYTIPAFAAYADNVVGDTAGALGTFAFCSPTGLLDLTQTSIGPTTEVGTATVDGQSTTEYAVTINPTTFLGSPGISPGETQAMQSAIGLLGGSSILDDVYIAASGDIVRTVSSVDGASLQVDLSNFGGAGTVTMPPQQSNIQTSTEIPNPTEVCSNTGEVSGSGIGAATNDTTTTTLPNATPTGIRASTTTTIPCVGSHGGGASGGGSFGGVTSTTVASGG